MDNILDILETIESDNSRNFKEDILRQQRHNDLLKRVFIAAGDPYTNFFLSKFKMPKALEIEDENSLSDDAAVENFLDFIYEDLSTRKKTGNAAKAAVDAVFSRMTKRQQKWCLRILLRNLRVGVMESTVNKVWPGSIKKFAVQLAESLASTHDPGSGIVIKDEIRYPVRVEPKLDGLRCIAIKRNGAVTMFARSGSEIDTPGVQEIKRALENSPWDNFVLDGELLDDDGTWNSTSSGVLKKK